MKNLIQALSRARQNFGSIRKDGEAVIASKGGKERRYTYAELDDIIAATAPALAAEGLHVYHTSALNEGVLEVTCHVTDGENELTSTAPMPTDGIGEQYNQAQAVGSLLTYGRRYSISALLCVCTDQDDDAQSARKEPQPVSKPESKAIKPTIQTQDAPAARQVGRAMVDRQQQMEWLNRKFDEHGLVQSDRDRILAAVEGKTVNQIISEIQSCACTANRERA